MYILVADDPSTPQSCFLVSCWIFPSLVSFISFSGVYSLTSVSHGTWPPVHYNNICREGVHVPASCASPHNTVVYLMLTLGKENCGLVWRTQVEIVIICIVTVLRSSHVVDYHISVNCWFYGVAVSFYCLHLYLVKDSSMSLFALWLCKSPYHVHYHVVDSYDIVFINDSAEGTLYGLYIADYG